MIQKIARFIGVSLDDELLDIVIRKSSRDFMLAHEHQFDERHIRAIGEKRAGLPPAINLKKVTPGTSNEKRYQLSPALKIMLDDIWREQITPKYGFKNYEDLRQSHREQDRFKKY